MCGRIERDTVRRAALGIAAHVRPVPARFDPEHVLDADAGSPQRVEHHVHDRRHCSSWAVAYGYREPKLLTAQDGDSMLGDVDRQLLLRRIGQVITECEPDPGVRAADAHDDQAVGRVEAEQMRNDSEYSVGRADANAAPQAGRARIDRTPVGCRRVLAWAFRRVLAGWLRLGWPVLASLRLAWERALRARVS